MGAWSLQFNPPLFIPHQLSTNAAFDFRPQSKFWNGKTKYQTFLIRASSANSPGAEQDKSVKDEEVTLTKLARDGMVLHNSFKVILFTFVSR
nr:multiple chloroplast division site 1 [Tanacetum cinerariifolium]